MAVLRLEAAEEALSRGDVDRAIVELSAAVRERTAADDRRGGAIAAARLGELFNTILMNHVAARPWFERARRLVADEAPCVEQGWVALAPMGCDVADPDELVERAALALDLARRFGDPALELKALADGGLGHVQAGRITEGMAMIDEAMALACGGAADDLEVVGKSVCSFYTACYYTADFARAASWTRLLRQRGIVGSFDGTAAFLSSHCDTVQAALLRHLGRWSDAEEVLLQSHANLEAAMPGAAWHSVIGLAELRILQGRLAEAEALLVGRDFHLEALLPMARLHLARGDIDLACATARRGLRVLADDRVRAATLLGVIAEAELRGGDLVAAARTSAELDERVFGLDVPMLRSEGARVRARVRAAEGDVTNATAALYEGLAALGGAELPLLEASLQLELAHLLEPVDRSAAIVEARAAAALLADLDVVLPADDVALLVRLDTRPDVAAPPCRLASLSLTDGIWTAQCGDTRVRLRDSKGLRYLAELLAHPGRERAAWDLVDLVEGTGEVDRRRLGDAGEAIDAQARDAYRRRISELRDTIEDALAVEDDDRAAAAQTELDDLVAELSRSIGLSGRARRASSTAEKARLNVTRALRAAIARVGEALPDAGLVLDHRVRTGNYCAYEPQAEDEVTWFVQS